MGLAWKELLLGACLSQRARPLSGRCSCGSARPLGASTRRGLALPGR